MLTRVQVFGHFFLILCDVPNALVSYGLNNWDYTNQDVLRTLMVDKDNLSWQYNDAHDEGNLKLGTNLLVVLNMLFRLFSNLFLAARSNTAFNSDGSSILRTFNPSPFPHREPPSKQNRPLSRAP